jgi:hypothetical protein
MFFFKPLSVVLALITVVTLIRPVLSEYYSSDITLKDILIASRITGEDARYHYLLGLYYYNDLADAGIDKAIDSYIESLKRNPLDSYSWIALARAYRDKGLNELAEHAARRASYLSKNSPYVLWESGIFLLEYNAQDAAALLRRYISLAPKEQDSVYSLFSAMGFEPEFILNNIVPREYSFYRSHLNYLMNNRLLPESADAWKLMKTLNPKKEDYVSYCNFLIADGELADAVKVWDEFAGRFGPAAYDRQMGDIIWNGDFELPAENGGFDWRLGHAEGVKVFIDREVRLTGNASLRASFDGRSNPDIYVAKQIAPVEPESLYRVKLSIRTEGITTLNGVFLDVSGYRCPNLTVRTEPVTGTTNLWKDISTEFVTPKDCMAVWLGIRREKSDKFDNRISGNVWIDSVSMAQARENKFQK